MRTWILMTAIAMSGWTAPAFAQESSRERAQTVLPAPVFASLDALAVELADEGIPSDPVFNKALEGMAKRVPAERIFPVVTRYAGQLRQAQSAFQGSSNGPLLVAGADAIQRGVTVEDLRALHGGGQGQGAGPQASPMAVLVFADLVEAGVPAERALGVLQEAMRMRTQEGEMLGISARVRQLMRQGQSPQEAAEQVRRSLQRGRGGGGVGPPVPPGSEPATKGRRNGRGNGGGSL
jgi:hypothetical protein